MRRKLLVPFPNLQPIEWAGARFTRALYLSFLKLDKTEPVPKEHFGGGRGVFQEEVQRLLREKRGTPRLRERVDVYVLVLITRV